MKKSIKVVLLSALVICLLLIVILLCVFVLPRHYFHGGTSSGQGWYAHETIVSNDMYILKTSIDEVEGMEVITFHIEDLNGEIVYSADGYYRTFDFKGIYFAENSNDVIVETGDVGDIIYYYKDGTWESDEDIIEEQSDLIESDNTLS